MGSVTGEVVRAAGGGQAAASGCGGGDGCRNGSVDWVLLWESRLAGLFEALLGAIAGAWSAW